MSAEARGVERALAGRRQRYEEEVERLVEATFRVTRDKQTANPSVADILAASGLSTSAFYRHFPTKDDLLVTLLERAHVLTRRHLEERLAAVVDPARRIDEWVRAMFDLVRSEDALRANRPFLLAHPRLLERFPDEIRSGFAALTVPLADAIAAGGGDPADAALTTQHVFGILVDQAALGTPADPSLVESVAAYTRRAVLP